MLSSLNDTCFRCFGSRKILNLENTLYLISVPRNQLASHHLNWRPCTKRSCCLPVEQKRRFLSVLYTSGELVLQVQFFFKENGASENWKHQENTTLQIGEIWGGGNQLTL